jgi:hypothetical protein
VVLAEITFRLWRRRNSRELALKPDLPTMSVAEFKTLVSNKRQLWIMDNCVLDNWSLTKYFHYDHFHPGGKFTLTKNFGRDISKYLYGGYKLVNSI